MSNTDQTAAVLAIQQAKARYFRGVDKSDADLVRSVLHEDCVLDYMGCCTDPATGRDFFPQMNIVMRGRSAWSSSGFASMGIVSVHQGYDFDITFTGATQARSICAMTDRLFMPKDAPFALMTGFGYYDETYEKVNDAWQLKTLRIDRLRVEAA